MKVMNLDNRKLEVLEVGLNVLMDNYMYQPEDFDDIQPPMSEQEIRDLMVEIFLAKEKTNA
jgi:hypothetical protein